ncbi:hypothetical protein AC1031_008863 [Aphanomyces cochlioides]|nr:hypothetical protein AC1031_008863 [Aphanomyces cochlioides]
MKTETHLEDAVGYAASYRYANVVDFALENSIVCLELSIFMGKFMFLHFGLDRISRLKMLRKTCLEFLKLFHSLSQHMSNPTIYHCVIQDVETVLYLHERDDVHRDIHGSPPSMRLMTYVQTVEIDTGRSLRHQIRPYNSLAGCQLHLKRNPAWECPSCCRSAALS